MLTELGGSQVEVQRCSLSSEGPRLRPSGAQCAQTPVEVQQCPLRAEVAEVDLEVDAEVVEEQEEEEKEEKEKEKKENNSDKI